MSKKLLAGCFAVCFFSALAWYSGSLYSGKALREENARLLEQLQSLNHFTEKEEAPLPEKQTASTSSKDTDTDTTGTSEENLFLLREENGKIVVYRGDSGLLYEQTDISPDGLPPELQQEIRSGKTLAGEEELYDFLENYTS